MEIRDNFLSEDEFKKIKDFIIHSNHFPWFYLDGKVEENDGQFQFYHTFFTPEKKRK